MGFTLHHWVDEKGIVPMVDAWSMHDAHLIVLLSETQNAHRPHGVTQFRKLPSPLRTNTYTCSCLRQSRDRTEGHCPSSTWNSMASDQLAFPMHCLPFDRHQIFNGDTQQALQIIGLIPEHHLLLGGGGDCQPGHCQTASALAVGRRQSELISRPVRPPHWIHTATTVEMSVSLGGADPGSNKASSDQTTSHSFCQLFPWEMGWSVWRLWRVLLSCLPHGILTVLSCCDPQSP